jgi:FkbM family methyltransferase
MGRNMREIIMRTLLYFCRSVFQVCSIILGRDRWIKLQQHLNERLSISSFNFPIKLYMQKKYLCFPLYSLYDALRNFEEIYIKKVYDHQLFPTKLDCVIDVGAFLGIYTIKLQAKRIIAIELNPLIFPYLLINCELNGISGKVIPLNVALGNRVGKEKFYVSYLNPLNSSMIRKTRNTFIVKVIPLDLLIKVLRIDRIDILKIDVEGYELEVLKGGRKALRLTKAIVVASYHYKNEADEIVNELKDQFFIEIRRINGDAYVYGVSKSIKNHNH